MIREEVCEQVNESGFLLVTLAEERELFEKRWKVEEREVLEVMEVFGKRRKEKGVDLQIFQLWPFPCVI